MEITKRIIILRPDNSLKDRPPMVVPPQLTPNPYTCYFIAPLAPVIHIDTKQVLGQKCLVSLHKI